MFWHLPGSVTSVQRFSCCDCLLNRPALFAVRVLVCPCCSFAGRVWLFQGRTWGSRVDFDNSSLHVYRRVGIEQLCAQSNTGVYFEVSWVAYTLQ